MNEKRRRRALVRALDLHAVIMMMMTVMKIYVRKLSLVTENVPSAVKKFHLGLIRTCYILIKTWLFFYRK